MVGYVVVVVTVSWLVIMIGGLGRECGGWDDEEGGSFPGYVLLTGSLRDPVSN